MNHITRQRINCTLTRAKAMEALEHQAYPKALALRPTMKVHHRNSDSLTLFPATPERVTIHRRQDGAIATTPPGLEREFLLQRIPNTHSAIKVRAELLVETVRYDMHKLHISLMNNSMPFALRTTTQEERELHKLCNHAEHLADLTLQARDMFPNTARTQDMAFRALRDFLGEQETDRTLRLAGHKATLRHHNLVLRHHQALELLHPISPNTVLYWLQTVAQDSAHQSLTPHQVFQEARTSFNHRCRTLRVPGTNRDPRDLWCYLMDLDPAILTNSHISPQGILHLAAVTLAAGVAPAPWAVSRLLTQDRQNPVMPHRMSAAMAARSKLIQAQPDTPDRARAQALLLHQFELAVRELRRPHNWFKPSRNRLREHVQDLDGNTRDQRFPPPWEEWVNPIPRRRRERLPRGRPPQPTHACGDTEAGPEKHTTPREWFPPPLRLRRSPAAPPPTAQDVRQELRGPLGHRVQQAVQEAVLLESHPGRSLHLRVRDPGLRPAHTLLHLARLPDGTIHPISGGALAFNLRVPSPGVSPGPREPDQPWSSMGAASRAVQRVATPLVAAHWAKTHPGAQAPLPPPVHLEVQRHLESLDQETRSRTHDHDLSDRIDALIAGMADQGTWDIAHALDPQVTLETYNQVSRMGNHAHDLLDTNPGALQWVTQVAAITQPVNHPGQVITLARRSTQHHGLLKPAWRTLTAMPPDQLLSILALIGPHGAAHLANLIHRAGGRTTPGAIAMAADILHHRWYQPGITIREQPADPEGAHPGHDAEALLWNLQPRKPHFRPNMDICLGLLLRLGQDHPDRLPRARQQAAPVLDYATSATQEGVTITATTWGGAARAARQWHQGINRRWIQNQWDQLMARQRGKILTWSSALPSTNIEGRQAVPLTSQEDLHQESLRMNHCVIQYGHQCAQGLSRTFSLKSQNRSIATIELTREAAGWVATQVRGPHNIQVNPHIQDLANQLADLYTRAHREANSRVQQDSNTQPGAADPQTAPRDEP